MISANERAKLLKAHSIGPKMVEYLERSGIRTFGELATADPDNLLFQIEVETGVKLNSMGRDALINLITLAKTET